MTKQQQHQCDILVIGSGAAGLSLSLRLARKHKVTVLSKGPLNEGATYYAQGGIAAVFDEEDDSIDAHVDDTMIAGGGICEEDVVRFIAENAKDCVQWLIDGGVPFDQEETEDDEEPRYHLTRRVVTATGVFSMRQTQPAWQCKLPCRKTPTPTRTSQCWSATRLST